MKRSLLGLSLGLLLAMLTACSSTSKETQPAQPAQQSAKTQPAQQSTAPNDGIPNTKMSEKVTQDPYSFQVNSVTVDTKWNATVTEKQFVFVEITTTNNGTSNGSVFANSFTLKDGTGAEYAPYEPAASFYQGWIMPGKYLQGKVVFETPKGIKGLRLIVNKKNAIDLGQ